MSELGPALPGRRGFLRRLSTWFMAGGLLSGYGALAAMSARYLYPARARARRWQFLARVAAVPKGASIAYRAPSGERVAVARRAEEGTNGDFIALSSTCPHLGCQVHWQAGEQRFFCPCHNGAFDLEGRAIAGPPFDAGQSLGRYPLEIRQGLLFIEVPMEALPGPEKAS